MNKLFTFIAFIILQSLCAQKINTQTLEKIYLTAIKDRVDLSLINGQIYFESNEIIDKIKDSVKVANFNFLSNEELVDKAIKENKAIILYRVSHRKISKDTIDINFSVIRLTANETSRGKRRHKNAYFSLTEKPSRYLPDLRYVFDSRQKKWLLIENAFFKVN